MQKPHLCLDRRTRTQAIVSGCSPKSVPGHCFSSPLFIFPPALHSDKLQQTNEQRGRQADRQLKRKSFTCVSECTWTTLTDRTLTDRTPFRSCWYRDARHSKEWESDSPQTVKNATKRRRCMVHRRDVHATSLLGTSSLTMQVVHRSLHVRKHPHRHWEFGARDCPNGGRSFGCQRDAAANEALVTG